MNKIKKIRKNIEIKLKSLTPKENHGMVVTDILRTHYKDLLSFIDSLECDSHQPSKLKTSQFLRRVYYEEERLKSLEYLVKKEWSKAEEENNSSKISKMSDLLFFLKTIKLQPS